MKILVYGAGVLGCELASVLCRGKSHVTLLARGAWKDTIDQRGLTVRHALQFRTTRDSIPTVDHLEPHWVYDLIFVVLQASQLPQALPELSRNLSRHIVFIGNNAAPEETARQLLAQSPAEKEVAFGFLSAAGRREGTQVVSLHWGVRLRVGGLAEPLSPQFHKLLKKTAQHTPLRYLPQQRMDGWLKAHLALSLPLAYAVYAQNGHIDAIPPQQQQACLDAALEGCLLLRELGVPLPRDADESQYYPGPRRRQMERLLRLLVRTPLGPLCVSHHAMNAVEEIRCLDQAFQQLQAEAGLELPAWNALRQQGLHLLAPAHHHRS